MNIYTYDSSYWKSMYIHALYIILNKFHPGNPVASPKKTDRHDITVILLKVASNIITLPLPLNNNLALKFCLYTYMNMIY
jgi:hypothetical protein